MKRRTLGRMRRLLLRGGTATVLMAELLVLSSCSDERKPQIEAITVTDASGNPLPAITSIQHGGSVVYFDATVVNDVQYLGVDWTVTCSSALPPGTLAPGVVDTSCGTFTPTHTTSGPIPPYTLPAGITIVTSFTPPATVPKAGTVTITAHATSDPSVTSTLILTVT